MSQTKTNKIKIKKKFTYKSLVIEAIKSFPNERASSADIFAYSKAKYPDIFTSANSMTWKGNIRQLLSKSPEFIKVRSKGECLCKKCSDCAEKPNKYVWIYISREKLTQQEKALKRCLDLKSTM